MSEASEKGTALELAVRAIETAILRASPSFSEKTFRIESKKVVEIAGVRHEIDVWVDVDLAPSYDARFIFECKNWQDKVGKNDVIVLSEKIRATSSQRGFLVAREFTSDAESQAALDPRVTLQRVADLPVQDVPMPLAFHGISVEGTHANLTFARLGHKELGPDANRTPFDLASASFVVDGVQAPLPGYFDSWVSAERERRISTFPSTTAAEGLHELTFEADRSFTLGQATLNGQPIEAVMLRATVAVRVSRAVIISHFEVGTRGRAVTVALTVGPATVLAAFAELPNPPNAPRT